MKTDTWPVPSASSAPSITGMLNRPKLSVVISPTVNERPASSAWASVFGANPRRCAASATRSLVSARSLPCPLSALEAVPMDTPASTATSRIVTRLIRYSSALAFGSRLLTPCRPASSLRFRGKSGKPIPSTTEPQETQETTETAYVNDAELPPPVVPATGPASSAVMTPATSAVTTPATSPAGAPEQSRPDGVTGPVAPTAAAAGMHRPLAMTRLDAGLLHDWQQRNLAASLPLALRQLEDAGNLNNVRLAVRSAEHHARPDGIPSADGTATDGPASAGGTATDGPASAGGTATDGPASAGGTATDGPASA